MSNIKSSPLFVEIYRVYDEFMDDFEDTKLFIKK